MHNSLHDLFSRYGRKLNLENNAPARLNNADTALLLISGRVEVFAQRFADGIPMAARTHVFTASPGDVLYGAPATDEGFELLAVGGLDCTIIELDLACLHGQPCEPVLVSGLLASMEHFLVGLGQGLTRDIVPTPRLNMEAVADAPLEMALHTIAGPRHGVIWIRSVQGNSPLFLGLNELPNLQAANADSGAGILFPLPERCWLHGTGPATLDIVEDPGAEPHDLLLASLHAWCGLMLECLEMNTRIALVDTWNMLQHKQAADERHESSSARELAQVLYPAEQHAPPPGEGSALYKVMCQVGTASGISFTRPAQEEGLIPGSTASFDTPANIAELSGVRYRTVTLDDGWCEQDLGPLLAFDKKTNAPVAVFDNAKGKRMVMNADGVAHRLNRSNADSLADTAYTFFKPLPFTSLGIRELADVAFKDAGRDFYCALLTGLVAGFLGLILPLAAKTLFSQIIPTSDTQQLAAVIYVVVGAVLASAFLSLAGGLATLRLEARIEARLESALWDRLLRMPLSFFNKYTSGNLASRGAAIQRIRESLTTGALVTLTAGAFSLANLLYIFVLDSSLGMIVSMLMLIQGLMNWGLTRARLRHLRAASKIRSRLDGLTLQFLSGLHQLRAFGAEQRAFSRWASSFSRQRTHQHKAFQARNTLRSFNGGFTLLSLAAVFAVVGFGDNTLDSGSFIAFYVAFGALQAGVLKLIMSLLQIVAVLPQAERIKPILKHVPEDNNLKPAPGPLSGKIDVCAVSVGYDENAPLALDGVTFSVAPGEFLALVGPSGSGKSTLLRLLVGLDTPKTGSISFDDCDLAELNARLVRRKMGVVLQGFGILPGTIRQAIAGDRFPTDKELWEAAEISQIADTIRAMDKGMETTLRHNGSNLSGGQRQQLMIAKAVLHDPAILILDEATSALDNDNQARIIKRLEGLKSTRVVAAHRLSTIQNADRILVLDKGRIVESGSFQTLMDKQGLFHSMATRQIL